MLQRSEIQALLQKIMDKQNLNWLELVRLLNVAYTQSNDILLATILTGLKIKGESVDDIFHVSRFLQDNMIKITNAPECAIDTCGTGGDLLSTFNISTTSAFVIAEAGIPVIKHGGRSNRGGIGSSDVLSALDILLCKNPEDCNRALNNSNIAFLDAQSFHPALVTFRLVRQKIGIPTILNIAAPLVNPAHLTRRVIGVYAKNLVQKVADVLIQKQPTTHALVVYGGIDEITLCGETLVAEISNAPRDRYSSYTIRPEMFEMKRCAPEYIRGGENVQENAEITQGVLAGIITGPRADIVALNAGAGIYVGGLTKTLRDGVFMAKEIIKSGKGLKRLGEARLAL